MQAPATGGLPGERIFSAGQRIFILQDRSREIGMSECVETEFGDLNCLYIQRTHKNICTGPHIP